MAANIIQKKRLANEVKLLENQPLHYCTAYPDENNPLIWYFLIKGQKDTDYYGGEYIGKIVHSPKYPAEPPDYYMLTPSGRYNIGSKICLSNSSYHRGEWSSTWNIQSILIAFYSIWLDDKEHGISHITDTSVNRKKMAKDSINYNNKNNATIYKKFNLTHIRDSEPESKKTKEEDKKEEDKKEEVNKEEVKLDTISHQQVVQQVEIKEEKDEEEKIKKAIRVRKAKIVEQEEAIKEKSEKVNKSKKAVKEANSDIIEVKEEKPNKVNKSKKAVIKE